MSTISTTLPNSRPFLFDPADGKVWKADVMTARAYEHAHPLAVWRYDPWTGIGREAAEVAADPYGRLYVGTMTRRPVAPPDARVPLLVFSPYDGFPLQWEATRELYREHHPELVWRFNPWSGNPRHASDVESDPFGILIWDNAWGPLHAAPRREIMTLAECAAAEGPAPGPVTFAGPEPTETDPTGRGAHAPGAKMDAGKPRVWLCVSGFSRALGAVAEVTTRGAEKYAPNSWMEVPDGVDRYMEGFARHSLALGRGETHDTGPGGTGCLHKAQMIWNLLASLELELRNDEGWSRGS